MYIPRYLKPAVEQARKGFPAVLITGPRQSGKTTFLKQEYSDIADYVSFDDPLQRQFAGQDPNGFLDQFEKRPVILDEVQYVPDLFSYLKMRIDAERHRNGRFLMTGSQQFQFMKHISDSLAGRIAILELLPFNQREISSHFPKLSIQEHLWFGGYPANIVNPDQRGLWLSSYIRTYAERDVRQLQQIRDLAQFEQFLSLAASRHSQQLNFASVSRECGLSIPGCKKWFSLLTSTYLIYLLRPFYKNFGKRLLKTPKLYFTDSAIVAYLTRHGSSDLLWHGPMGGALFEGYVVMEIIKHQASLARQPNIYYWRSRDGLEVDLIMHIKNRIIPVEIKQTSTPTNQHIQSMVSFLEMAGKQEIEPGVLICNISKSISMPYGIKAIPWHAIPGWLDRLG
ncbi:ATP-binding protein [bacterium]|nr:ATP-binding protein [bacterium]